MSGLISELNKIVLPKKINPCPILESIIELRFSTSFPHDAIFGIIYKEFKDLYPKVEPLPILQLPEIVRREDKNLLYKPYSNGYYGRFWYGGNPFCTVDVHGRTFSTHHVYCRRFYNEYRA